MSAMITALRISYFMVIKIILFFEKKKKKVLIAVKYQHKILKCSKSSLIAFGHMEEDNTEGNNTIYFVPRKYKRSFLQRTLLQTHGGVPVHEKHQSVHSQGSPWLTNKSPQCAKSIPSHGAGTSRDMAPVPCQ